MDRLFWGFSVVGLGLLAVFIGLVILIQKMNRLSKLTASGERNLPEPGAQAEPAETNTTAVEGISNEVLAAIAAAVAAVWNGKSSLVIRHVKRIHNAPAWNRAGREEQTYSRF